MDGSTVESRGDELETCRITELVMKRAEPERRTSQSNVKLAPELRQYVDSLVSLSSVTVAEGHWRNTISRFTFLGEAQVYAARDELRRALQPKIAAQVAAMEQRIQMLAPNERGLGESRRIYDEITRGTIGLNPADARARELLAQLGQKRPAILAASTGALLATLAKAKSLDAVDRNRWRSGSLIPEFDENIPEGQRLLAAVDERRKQVIDEFDLDFVSKSERALSNAAGIVSVPDNYPAPTPGEIRLAMLRAVAAPQRIDSPTFTRIRLRIFDGIAGYFELAEVSQVNCRSAEPGLYSCRFQGLSSYWARNSWLSNPTPDAFKQIYLKKTFPHEETFRLTRDGWVSPSATAKLEQAALRGQESAAKALNRCFIFDPGCY